MQSLHMLPRPSAYGHSANAPGTVKLLDSPNLRSHPQHGFFGGVGSSTGAPREEPADANDGVIDGRRLLVATGVVGGVTATPTGGAERVFARGTIRTSPCGCSPGIESKRLNKSMANNHGEEGVRSAT